jgi:hypothetical protein
LSGLYNIWTDENYVYAATSSGLDVISLDTEESVSFTTRASGYTTVWANDTHVFLGTSDDGIKYLPKSRIIPGEINSRVLNYVKEPDLISNNVKYIHGNENKFMCCTEAGVNIVRPSTGYITSTAISGALKCFVTPGEDYFYYMTSSSIYRLDGNAGFWSSADRVYTTGSGFLATGTSLNDIYVTEHTSVSGIDNTLFVVSDFGAHVYDEGSGYFVLFTTVS